VQMETLPGVHTIPDCAVSRMVLERISGDADGAAAAYKEIQEDLGCKEDYMMLIKPRHDGGSTGVMALRSADDFQTYCLAVAGGWYNIPAELTAGASLSTTGAVDVRRL
jgi:hypothetical protein